MKHFKSCTLALLAMAILLLNGCASLIGAREVVVPLEKLQAAVDRKFPLNQRYLDMFEVRVGRPRLGLQPESSRILITLDAQIAPTLFGQGWGGNLAMSGMLRLDAGRNAVILTEPRVERFTLEGVDPRFTEKMGQFGERVAEQLLRDLPLYTFSPDEFRYAGIAFVPARIRTRSDALVVSFVPAK